MTNIAKEVANNAANRANQNAIKAEKRRTQQEAAEAKAKAAAEAEAAEVAKQFADKAEAKAKAAELTKEANAAWDEYRAKADAAKAAQSEALTEAEAKAKAEAEAADKAHWEKRAAVDKENVRKNREALKMPQLSEAAEDARDLIKADSGILKTAFTLSKYRFTIVDIATDYDGNILIAFKLASGKKAKDSSEWTYSDTALNLYHFRFNVTAVTERNERDQQVVTDFHVSWAEQIHKLAYQTAKESGERESLSTLIKLVKLEASGKELNKSNEVKAKFYRSFFGVETLAEALDIIKAVVNGTEAEAESVKA